MLGAFENEKSSDVPEVGPLNSGTSRVSLYDAPSDGFFHGFEELSLGEALDEPATPLQEIREFLSGMLARENRTWLLIRVIPGALLLIAGVLLWPSSDSDDTEVAIRTSTFSTPQVELAEIAPGLQGSRVNPELLVDLGADGIRNSGDEAGLTTTSVTAAEDEAEDSDSADGDGPEEAATSSTAAGNNVGQDETATTTGRTTTTEADTTTVTEAPTTQAPTTEDATTTVAQTTVAPTTQPPTTPAPTTTEAPTTTTTSPPSNNCSGGGEFERIFRDDFNGSSIGSGWSLYNSQGNAGYGLRRPSAITVQDGKLVITARMENGNLVSGGMSQSIHQTYGKYVIRVRTDNDPSQAVSGVVLTWPSSGAHPRDGENNIYETLVQTANRNPFFTFIHKPFGSVHDQEYKEHHADGSQFQTMTMEWTPSRITITREGPGNNGNWDSWTVTETGSDLIPDVNHHLAIQLDGWKHSIGGDVRMEVDFVEIHKYCG